MQNPVTYRHWFTAQPALFPIARLARILSQSVGKGCPSTILGCEDIDRAGQVWITQTTGPKWAFLGQLTVFLLGLLLLPTTLWAQAKGEIEIDLVDSKSMQPLQCRVQLRGPSGASIKPKSIDSLGPWNLVNGKLSFRGRPGEYQYEIFHSPEYAPGHGRFILDDNSEAIDSIELPRHADLMSENWLGGDLLCYLPKARSSLWLNAEAMYLAASVSGSTTDSKNQVNDTANHVSFLDSRPGSGLLIHHWHPDQLKQLDQLGDLIEPGTPSSKLILAAKKASVDDANYPVHIEIQKLWARDLPVWLASGRVDSVQLLSDHLTFDGKSSVDVKPLVMPEGRYQGGRAAGRIVEQIYWKMLDAGLRIPPTAGSGCGNGAAPLGYNRVYGLVGSKRAENWWQAIQAGNSFVTNGPLLRVSINGMPPGQVFKSDQPVTLDTVATITVGDPVEYLEVVHNGQSLYRAGLDEYAKQGGKLPVFAIDQSGWLILRVVTGRDFTYRMATTAPYYFEIKGSQRIEAKAVEFFQQWLAASRKEIGRMPVEVQQAHEPFLQSAERFWQTRRSQATP